MRTYEIEQKYRLVHPQKTKRLLIRLGAKKIAGGIESNELLDLNEALKRKGSLLRSRRHGSGIARLTFKGARLKGRYKKRLEIEITVDYARAKEIFQFLGFKVVANYTKKREEFSLGTCKVALDYLPKVGWFIEIEGKPSTIQHVSMKLGLRKADREELSYLGLLHRQKAKS